MRRPKQFRPSAGEPLEDRLVLSYAAVPHVPVQVLPKPAPLHLVGIIEGRATIPVSPADVGEVVSLSGSGAVTPLGRMRAIGVIHEAGFILNGQDHGALTLSNKRGSVTLSLTRLTSDTPVPQGSNGWTFQIVGGTRAYKGATGTGTAEIVYGGPIQVMGPNQNQHARPAATSRPFELALNTTPTGVLPL